MWSTVFGIVIGLGALSAWKGYVNRNGETEPPGVDKGTPVREWPKATAGRESLNCQFARNWKPFLFGGLALTLLGLVGTFVQVMNETTSPSSRDEVMEVISSNPNNTLDREELNCLFDFMDTAGIDITSATEEDLIAQLVSATAAMSEAELDQFDECFDAESRARADDRVAAMSDEQLRQFFIESLVADPIDPMTRSSAECVLDVIEERGVLRDLVTVDQGISADLEAALTESDSTCP